MPSFTLGMLLCSCKLFCNHEGTRWKVESEVQEDRMEREPVWVPEDTADPLPLPALRLSPENRRYLDAAAAFSQLFNNLQPKTSQLHFPDKCKHFICVLPNTHSQSWFLRCTLWAGSQDTHPVPTSAMYSLCGLGKVTKPLWSRILMHKKVLIHLLFILQGVPVRIQWGNRPETALLMQRSVPVGGRGEDLKVKKTKKFSPSSGRNMCSNQNHACLRCVSWGHSGGICSSEPPPAC